MSEPEREHQAAKPRGSGPLAKGARGGGWPKFEYERRLLRDLMDNSPDGIYFKDVDVRFLRANAAYARGIDGRTPEALVGRRLSEILGADSEAAG
ncbi:MAG: PAS domain-containing protein [Pseudomonadota bacterium]